MPRPRWAVAAPVRFTADGPDRTTVELEHRHLDRLVGGQAMHDGIGGDWTSVLERYAAGTADEK